MKRWNLKNIILYNHLLEKKELEFNLTGITIITGKSNKGKSALAEIIDYALGAGECHIPGVVRTSCSWCGIKLQKDENQILILRKMPSNKTKSSSEIYLEMGKNIIAPENKDLINSNVNTDTLVNKIEQIFGIGNINLNYFDSEYKKNQSLSIRNYMSYLLQDDDVIISKNNLLRGLNNERRQSIIDSSPYFLGAVDERIIEKRSELNKLKKEYNAYIRRLEKNESLKNANNFTLKNLLEEAKQVGLFIKEEDISENKDIISILKDLLKNDEILEERKKSNEDKSILDKLREDKAKIGYEITKLNQEKESIRELLSNSKEFKNHGDIQKERLSSINLLPKIVEKYKHVHYVRQIY